MKTNKRTVVGMVISAMLLGGGVASAQTSHDPNTQAQAKADTASRAMMMQGDMSRGMMPGKMRAASGQKQGMMQQGMMGKMHQGMSSMMAGMEGPLYKYVRALGHAPEWFQKIELTDEQKSQITQLRAAFLKRQADYQAEMKKAKVDIDLLLGENASSADVKKLVDKYYSAKVEMLVEAYQTVQKIRSLLTPEQQEKFDAALAKGGPCPMCGKGGMMGGKPVKRMERSR